MNNPMTRRVLLRNGGLLSVVTLAGGVLAACSSASTSTSTSTSAAAPASPTQAAPVQTQQVSLRLGWLANSQYAGDFVALDKGYRLGFEASSDHISTHISYCNVYVKDLTREGILEALKSRHIYIGVHHDLRRELMARIHPHVERPIAHDTETALRIFQLAQ